MLEHTGYVINQTPNELRNISSGNVRKEVALIEMGSSTTVREHKIAKEIESLLFLTGRSCAILYTTCPSDGLIDPEMKPSQVAELSLMLPTLRELPNATPLK